MPRRLADTLDRLIGANLRRARSEAGLTQLDLARAIGVSQQQIQKYETETSPLTASSVVRVALALGVPLDRIWQDILAPS